MIVKKIMNNGTYFPVELANSLEFTLNFVQNTNATNDIDLLIVIQTFVQQITSNLKQHLDPSMIH
jgi:hypothetical protein